MQIAADKQARGAALISDLLLAARLVEIDCKP
jgi:hypothetical protein